MRTEHGKLKTVGALVFLMVAGVHFALAQATKPSGSTAEDARLAAYLDKNGGYRDSFGGYYDPKAGTYTDNKGGVLDNWKGYTYKDGSYKSKLGDFWNPATKTFHLASGEVVKSPDASSADAITVLRQAVEETGGFDKTFIQRAMLDQIRQDHPAKPTFSSAEQTRLMTFVDKNGGYRDKQGGYYDPKAGTYTDADGGVVDNWKGYTYKDGSYKTQYGDYWDGPTKTFKLADGSVTPRPNMSNADAIKAFRENVEQNGGYDKDFCRIGMLQAIANEHPKH